MIAARPIIAAAWVLSAMLSAGAVTAAADPHFARPVTELEPELEGQPLQIASATQSRPRARGDVALKAEVSFGGGPPYRVKLRKAQPGADAFNNRPRYDLAAYELQKLFLDPADYVVPPTALRMIPLADLQPHAPTARPTFPGSDDVLAVVQYWLQDVTLAKDAYDAARFDADRAYARRIGQLNIFTYLVRHSDSNLGNFLVSRSPGEFRVFSVDNNVAFGSDESDRGLLWRNLRVTRLPADAVERLRRIDDTQLRSRLAVLAQWELRDGHYLPVSPGGNLAPARGVRVGDGVVQMGLTSGEIWRVGYRLKHLLKEVDRGGIDTF
jgi:hypothetical protein